MFFFLSLFILRERVSAGEGAVRDRMSRGGIERDGERDRGGAETEREVERIPSRLRCVSAEPDAGLSHTDCEIMT